MHEEQGNYENLSSWQYGVMSENCRHIEIGKYHTYGIEVNGREYAEILHDVSIDRETVNRMVGLFNEYQLSPIHLKDAVTDLLP